MQLQTSITAIAEAAKQKETENIQFAEQLLQMNSEEVDTAVHQLNQTIEPQIDCTQCGNCCKTLMVNITGEEADRASAHLQMTRQAFDEAYVEKGSHELMIINAIPCHFLKGTSCSIYEHRFAGCREFPALHLPHFTQRLFTVMMHYDRCPIIFNVVEALKKETGFAPVS
ncbi:MAG: YkgJ family cysteine cluster protein [Chitinophagaceae bacterium]|nr:YkgJ family cysteine cluster protein [Chitinophagaceae bacterium]